MPVENSLGGQLTVRTFFDEARSRADRIAAAEKRSIEKGRIPWVVYETPTTRSAYRYQETFIDVLGGSFNNFLTRRRATKGKVFTMDVMGTGGFTGYYNVDGEVAITLYDPRTDDQKAVDAKRNKLVIPGNVLDLPTWHPADNFIKAYDVSDFPGFDLITCQPEGGWDVIFDGPNVGVDYSYGGAYADLGVWLVVQRSFHALSPQGGTALVQLSKEVDYSMWFDRLKQVPELEVVDKVNILRLTKNSSPKGLLPRMPYVPNYSYKPISYTNGLL